jgi:hypothetical protein
MMLWLTLLAVAAGAFALAYVAWLIATGGDDAYLRRN